jgi:hypothetical protein
MTNFIIDHLLYFVLNLYAEENKTKQKKQKSR